MTEPDKASSEDCAVAACAATATARCRRCGDPLCDEHAPAGDQRCESCEAEFCEVAAKVEPPADRFVVWAALAIVGAFLVNWLLLTFTQVEEWLALLAGGVVFAGVAGVYMLALHPEDARKRKLAALRREFLAERKGD